MADVTEVRCRNPDCDGTIGSYNAGTLYDAPHLRPGDTYIPPDNQPRWRCNRCHAVNIILLGPPGTPKRIVLEPRDG